MNKNKILAAFALAFALGLAAPTAIYAEEAPLVQEQISAEDSDEANNENNLENEELPAPTAEEDVLEPAPVEGEPVTQADNTTQQVSTAADLITQAADPTVSVIELTGDITVTSTSIIDITRNSTEPLTIDLKGNTIRTSEGIIPVIIRQGNITFVNGTIENTGIANSKSAIQVIGSSDSTANEHVTLTIAEDVTLKATNCYGLTVHYGTNAGNSSYGVKVVLAGTITAPYGISVNGNIQHANAPSIIIEDTALIESSATDANGDKIGAGIYAAGNATWSISGTIDSGTGIIAKAGNFNINGATIIASGAEITPVPANNYADDSGATFQVEKNSAYSSTGPVEIHITGGTYSSKNNNVFYEYGINGSDDHFSEITIKGGTYNAGTGHTIFNDAAEEDKVTIENGVFKSPISTDNNKDFGLGSGSKFIEKTDENGNAYWVVATETGTVVADQNSTTGAGQGANIDEKAPNTGVFGSADVAAKVSNLTTSVISVLAGTLIASGIALVVLRRMRKAGDKKN